MWRRTLRRSPGPAPALPLRAPSTSCFFYALIQIATDDAARQCFAQVADIQPPPGALTMNSLPHDAEYFVRQKHPQEPFWPKAFGFRPLLPQCAP